MRRHMSLLKELRNLRKSWCYKHFAPSGAEELMPCSSVVTNVNYRRR